MSRATVTHTVTGLSMLLMGGGVFTACGGGGEELDLVRAFFQASRFGDRSTLGNMSMVIFDPQEDGIASSPSIENVTEEDRRVLQVQELSASLQELQAEERTFREEKKLYQDENFDTITRVIEAERANEDVASGDQEVQDAWSEWRAEEQAFARKVSDAQAALNEEMRVANASLYDPSNPINVSAYEGELITKDVTVSADVALNGESEERTMVLTLQKVDLQGPDGPIEGRWIITAIE